MKGSITNVGALVRVSSVGNGNGGITVQCFAFVESVGVMSVRLAPVAIDADGVVALVAQPFEQPAARLADDVAEEHHVVSRHVR